MSRYNPDKHHRRSIRLQGYDYTQAGTYFVTIATQGRELLFGDVIDGEMVLNAYGRVVHGIIVITDTPRRSRGDAFPKERSNGPGVTSEEFPVATGTLSGECVATTTGHAIPTGPPSGSLGAIVGNFKSVTSRRINRMRKTPGVPIWQRNYCARCAASRRIIRNERELNATRQYIYDNPARWLNDAENPVT